MNKKELTSLIYEKNSDDILKFIKENFSYHKPKNIRAQLNILKSLDEKTIKYGIVRLKTLDESLDPYKFLPILVTTLMSILAAYSGVLSGIWINILLVAGGLAVFLMLSNVIRNFTLEKGSIIYFRQLLEMALDEKEKINQLRNTL